MTKKVPHKKRIVQLVIQCQLLALGIMFSIVAALTDNPVMDNRVYGNVITSVSAEVWSWPIVIVSMLYILGILINGNWKYSSVLRVIGSLFHVCTLGLFGYFGYQLSATNPLVLAAFIVGSCNLYFLYLNIGDLCVALRKGKRKCH